MQNYNIDKVTIVTVTYNTEDLLEETILSVINQSYQNIEYIIIDGASTDRTIDIIKKYEKRIDYWISEPDEGIYFAMNKAIEKASGTWINFMNAGDTFADMNTVEYVMNSVEDDTDLVYGEHFNDKKEHCSIEHRQNILRSMPCCHQSLYVKTQLMKDNPFNTFYKISADYEFILKMYQQEKVFKYIKEPLCIYLEGGLSDRAILQRELETITLYMTHKVAIEDIIHSSAHRNIVKSFSFVKQQTEWINKHKSLQLAIGELAAISVLRHPIKKIKSYKKLLALYYKQ